MRHRYGPDSGQGERAPLPQRAQVRRTLLIPGTCPRGITKRVATAGITRAGASSCRSSSPTRADVPAQATHPRTIGDEADNVLLHAGWSGKFDFELKRAVEALTNGPWRDAERRKIVYTWDEGGDPDFKIFEARENTEETGLVPLRCRGYWFPRPAIASFFSVWARRCTKASRLIRVAPSTTLSIPRATNSSTGCAIVG